MIRKGSWVQIRRVVLNPDERAYNLPDATKKVPLLLWVKGYLLHDANINDTAKIMTVTGRIEEGELLIENPSYMHTYGNFIPEIKVIDSIVKDTLFKGDDYE